MKFEKPNENITPRDIAFGPMNLSGWLPAVQNIPREFWIDSNKWASLMNSWFFNGIKEWPITKEGIDFKSATAHIRTIMASFDPKHEHKIAGCAYLASLWFDEKTLNGGKSK